MTAINFPDSPSVDDEFTSGDRTWIWNGTVWKAKFSVVVGPTGPTGASFPSQTGNSGELLVTDGTDASWSNTVTANSTSVPAIIAKGKPSHASTIFAVYADRVTNPDLIEVTESTFGTKLPINIFGISSSVVPLKVIGATSQSNNLQEWRDSSGNILGSVSSSGQFYVTPATAAAADTAKNVGYVGMPQVSTGSNITALGVSHAGKHIYSTTTGLTHTISSNASSAMEVGTTFVFINPAAVTTSIAITSDTLILAGAGTTGTRTLAPYGMATAVKITATSWMISGNGLS